MRAMVIEYAQSKGEGIVETGNGGLYIITPSEQGTVNTGRLEPGAIVEIDIIDEPSADGCVYGRAEVNI